MNHPCDDHPAPCRFEELAILELATHLQSIRKWAETMRRRNFHAALNDMTGRITALEQALACLAANAASRGYPITEVPKEGLK